MSLFALISLLAATVTAFLGICVLQRNPGETLHRTFFLYCLFGSLWCFMEFGYRQAESFSTALGWLRASSLSLFAMPFELHFILCFTEQTKLLEKKLIYLPLYAPAAAFAALEMTSPAGARPVKAYWGWTYVLPRHGIPPVLFDVWFTFLSFFGLYLCLRYHLRMIDPKEKRRSGLVALGTAVPLALALATEPGGAFDYLGFEIPELTSIGFAIECILLAYAMWKYELFPLTPASVAEDIITTLTDALCLVNLQGQIVSANAAASALLGYRESELVGQPVEMIFVPEKAADLKRTQLEQLRATGFVRDAEVTLVTRDARRIPVSFSLSIVRDRDGTEQGVVYVIRDLTERKLVEQQIRRALKEKEALLKEIHHRVKNNLQVVSSLLKLQIGATKDERAIEALRESQNRIYSMAFVHEMLYISEDLAEVDVTTLTTRLAHSLLGAYGGNQQAVTLKMNLDEVSLGMDAAIPCSLIINELVTNALKHAFPPDQTGEICIDLRATDGQIVLTVSDNGIGLPPEVKVHQAESLGLQLVNTLTEQLEGSLDIDRRSGTAFRIAFSPCNQNS
jgi:PAS domain S-box-containing protein